MKLYKILRHPTTSFEIFRMLLTGIPVGSPLSIWDNLRYPQDKICCVEFSRMIIERSLGLLKGQFRNIFDTSPMTRADLIAKYIVICCILHIFVNFIMT